ncbi:MAG TPA: SDR family oxidoreductase [Bryobacteraceae bacterium]|nr:SDR family oxidoreductase [Bryobacteraceae bacterium]
MNSLKGAGVLVTGAGRGIGKRLAIGFAQNGARVGLLARSKTELDLAQLEIEHAGGVALRLRADVNDHEQLVGAVDRMRVQFGDVRVLVCAAAVQGYIGPFAGSPTKSWAEIFQTNLFGVMNSCRAVLPHMIERRAGKIIALSGPGATASRPNFSVYAAAKAALARFVETLAEEVRDHNIQVNCMHPGPAYTSMTDEILKAGERAGEREIEAATTVRASGGIPAEQQIQLSLFLASDDSNHVSGKLISVNDNWKKLRSQSLDADLFTLRRRQKP